ncbi:hypothetical protein J6590_077546 [Homalodisca vitripennis]|nr:hypothetical protein J6590_077546 [Homalodisca vitripennis]
MKEKPRRILAAFLEAACLAKPLRQESERIAMTPRQDDPQTAVNSAGQGQRDARRRATLQLQTGSVDTFLSWGTFSLALSRCRPTQWSHCHKGCSFL